jgi:hypothetical protein
MNFETQALQHCVPNELFSGLELGSDSDSYTNLHSFYDHGIKFKAIVSSLQDSFELGSD